MEAFREGEVVFVVIGKSNMVTSVSRVLLAEEARQWNFAHAKRKK